MSSSVNPVSYASTILNLVTNIIIDLSAQTASLTITKDAIPIETINFASNQITFLERGDISISGTEFLDLLAQIEIFQTALLKNFPLNKGILKSWINFLKSSDIKILGVYTDITVYFIKFLLNELL